MARDAIEKDVIKAFLGDDTEFKGLLSFDGTVRIDGRFEGEVETKDNLIIGEHAKVRAEIKVGTIMIQGSFEGNITAEKKLHITSKGKVIGNITTPALHVEDGAVLEGAVSMIKRDAGKIRPLVLKKGAEAGESAPSFQSLEEEGPGKPAANA